ncbi:hypothetical protein DFQ27_001908, partial [Actinomortierella ambigua]
MSGQVCLRGVINKCFNNPATAPNPRCCSHCHPGALVVPEERSDQTSQALRVGRVIQTAQPVETRQNGGRSRKLKQHEKEHARQCLRQWVGVATRYLRKSIAWATRDAVLRDNQISKLCNNIQNIVSVDSIITFVPDCQFYSPTWPDPFFRDGLYRVLLGLQAQYPPTKARKKTRLGATTSGPTQCSAGTVQTDTLEKPS